jgi:hypothetical protein
MFEEIVKEPDVHLKFGEKIIAKGSVFMVVDVTACAWLNPPKEQVALEMESVTCEHCIDRGKYKNGWKRR